MHANPRLAALINEKIGDGLITDLPQITGILKYADDE